MIFPILRGLVHPVLAPVTYLFVFLNVLVYLATFDDYQKADTRMDLILSDETFLETQGAAFSVMIQKNAKSFSQTLQALARRSLGSEDCGTGESSISCRRLLGGLAIRNSYFMAHAETFAFEGDEIALTDWKKRFHELKELQNEHPSYQWGVSQLRPNLMQWVSYQFSHSGCLHLFRNVMFLVLFGAFVETRLGGSFVALAYVGGGLMGALFYSLLSGISASPLVGASGAVSGLIGLVAFAWLKREGLRYFYWLLPIQGYFGFVVLPSWIVLVVTVLPDVSGYFASAEEVGSVAFTAHLGGVVWGATLSAFLAIGLMVKEIDETQENAEDNDDWMQKAG